MTDSDFLAEIDPRPFEESLVLDKQASLDSISVWAALEDRFVIPLLIEALAPPASEEISESSPWDVIADVFPDARPEVECAVSSSMVSGTWGMSSFLLGGIGYFFEVPDSDFIDEAPYRLLGGWSPDGSVDAYRRSFVATYVHACHIIGLPPFYGEHASGPLDLMTEAVVRLEGSRAIHDMDPERLQAAVGAIDAVSLAQRSGVPLPAVELALADLSRGSGVQLSGRDSERALAAISLVAIDDSPFR